MATALINNSGSALHSFQRRAGRIIRWLPCSEGAKWPSKQIPKASMRLLAVEATLGQLDRSTALVL